MFKQLEAAFKKESDSERKYKFKEAGTEFEVVIKEGSPNTSHGKINEDRISDVFKEVGGELDWESRQQDGKTVHNYAKVSGIDGIKAVALSFKSTSKFRTTTLRIY